MQITKVYFTINAIEKIHYIIKKYGSENEVGGCLVGCQIDESLVVTHASEPGPRAKMSRYSVNIDNKYTTRFSNEINTVTNNKLYYIGDWHTHLSTDLRASQTDVKALKVLNNYVPKGLEYSIISVILNHFNNNQLKVYKLSNTSDLTLEDLSWDIIENPSWLNQYI